MINFHYEIDFRLECEDDFRLWIKNLILEEECKLGEINYIFCSDEYLHKINMEYLKHDTLTDIISFDYSVGKELHGDIYISIERVRDNAVSFNEAFHVELARVIAHGVLHYCGYKDKSVSEKSVMRAKEDYYIEKRSF